MTSTERVLFAAVNTEEVSAVVARRLRAAIALGFLSDGDKLPKEADLARQLGVTAFSLREALGILRSEKLISTRAGKNGGSFINRTKETDFMAGEELIRLSASELRDLSDWRKMLVTQAAALAAERASESAIPRLSAYALAVTEATTPTEARRALGRFHVELAASAQSARLSRAEFQMHEEFDWLVSATLADEVGRNKTAYGLRQITDAVASRKPEEARRAAELLMNVTITELIRRRLSIIADRHRRSEPRDSTLVEELGRFTTSFIDRLNVVADDMAGPLGDETNSAKIHARAAMAVVAQTEDLESFVDGLGVLAQVGLVPGHPYWMAWWQRTTDNTFALDEHHMLDSHREDFYDYESKEYFSTPRETGKPWASGPFVDHGGVDDYMITISVPIVRDATFLGISAADLRVSRLEEFFAPWLAAADSLCVLLNAESRVILSNSVTYNVGDVVLDHVDLDITPLGRFGWSFARSA